MATGRPRQPSGLAAADKATRPRRFFVPDLSELSIFGIGVKKKDVGELRDKNLEAIEGLRRAAIQARDDTVEAIEGLQRALILEHDQHRRLAERVRELERRP